MPLLVKSSNSIMRLARVSPSPRPRFLGSESGVEDGFALFSLGFYVEAVG